MIIGAPLPSLQTALSRRSAVFGVVTLAAAPTTVARATARWDADLIALEARLRLVMDGARRALEPVPDDECEAHNERLDHADSILSRMTLTELRALNVPALWASLLAEHQAAVGAAALAVQFAGLVAGDDGSETTGADRNRALDLEGDALNALGRATEAAFLAVQWWAP